MTLGQESHHIHVCTCLQGSEKKESRLERVHATTLTVVLSKFKINIQNIQLIKQLTSVGNFASIWEGSWKGNKKVTVKVHMKPGGLSDAEFLQDAVMMTHLHHPNLVQLLAVCREDNQPAYIITELMKLGALSNYLKTKDGQSLKIPQLITMCGQIARGMAYIESQNCIHCDLRAQNILVTENLACKVTNFFLARSGFYKETVSIKYSFRWSPPEILDGQFTSKYDVWSFGIVLYEVITYGKIPYSGMSNSEVVPKVCQGYRLPKPENCPGKLYEMMLDCWKKKPESRPTFETLQSQLEDFFTEEEEKDSCKFNQITRHQEVSVLTFS